MRRGSLKKCNQRIVAANGKLRGWFNEAYGSSRVIDTRRGQIVKADGRQLP